MKFERTAGDQWDVIDEETNKLGEVRGQGGVVSFCPAPSCELLAEELTEIAGFVQAQAAHA